MMSSGPSPESAGSTYTPPLVHFVSSPPSSSVKAISPTGGTAAQDVPSNVTESIRIGKDIYTRRNQFKTNYGLADSKEIDTLRDLFNTTTGDLRKRVSDLTVDERALINKALTYRISSITRQLKEPSLRYVLAYQPLYTIKQSLEQLLSAIEGAAPPSSTAPPAAVINNTTRKGVVEYLPSILDRFAYLVTHPDKLKGAADVDKWNDILAAMMDMTPSSMSFGDKTASNASKEIVKNLSANSEKLNSNISKFKNVSDYIKSRSNQHKECTTAKEYLTKLKDALVTYQLVDTDERDTDTGSILKDRLKARFLNSMTIILSHYNRDVFNNDVYTIVNTKRVLQVYDPGPRNTERNEKKAALDTAKKKAEAAAAAAAATATAATAAATAAAAVTKAEEDLAAVTKPSPIQECLGLIESIMNNIVLSKIDGTTNPNAYGIYKFDKVMSKQLLPYITKYTDTIKGTGITEEGAPISRITTQPFMWFQLGSEMSVPSGLMAKLKTDKVTVDIFKKFIEEDKESSVFLIITYGYPLDVTGIYCLLHKYNIDDKDNKDGIKTWNDTLTANYPFTSPGSTGIFSTGASPVFAPSGGPKLSSINITKSSIPAYGINTHLSFLMLQYLTFLASVNFPVPSNDRYEKLKLPLA